MTLAWLCHRWAGDRSQDVVAVHVDHALHPDSQAWAERTQAACVAIGLPCAVTRVEVCANAGESLEEAARRARYDALRESMREGDILATAHHRDDQAETVLLRLMRGAGVSGLAAIRPVRAFGPGRLVRPLLELSRADVRTWARAHIDEWVEDPDNENPARERNYLRHRIMPLLTARWPAAGEMIARSADWCRAADEALEQLRTPLLEATTDGRRGLDIASLDALERDAARWVLRRAILNAGLPPPPETAVVRVLEEMMPARADAAPKVSWRGGEIRRYRRALYCMAPLPAPPAAEALIPWSTGEPLQLPQGLGQLSLEGPHQPLTLAIGWPVGGETIRLPNRPTRRLKKLFQERGVPPWVRRRTPLIYRDDLLWSVGGTINSDACLTFLATHKMRLSWSQAPFDLP